MEIQLNRLSTAAALVTLWVLILGLTGCNMFDGLDSALVSRTDQELVREGDLALESGDLTAAQERFDQLLARGNLEDATLRGKGETTAGQAGFRVLGILDGLQNGVGPYDRAPVCFKIARLVTDRPRLEEGITWMSRIAVPSRPDRIARALMKVAASVRLLLDKYDTNNNRRLDPFDEIDFDTNDRTLPAWPQIYQDLVTGPASDRETLEQAFTDLVYGFDGRGATWTTVTPVIGQPFAGTYTDINRATIMAIGDLTERLEAANPYFEVNVGSFAAAIRLLDGAE